MVSRDTSERIKRGLNIVERGGVTPENIRFIPYTVLGDTGEEYKVRLYPEDETWTCTCPDHVERHRTCKHIWAAIMFRQNR